MCIRDRSDGLIISGVRPDTCGLGALSTHSSIASLNRRWATPHISQAACSFLLSLCYSISGYQFDRRLRTGPATIRELLLWTEHCQKYTLNRTGDPQVGDSALHHSQLPRDEVRAAALVARHRVENDEIEFHDAAQFAMRCPNHASNCHARPSSLLCGPKIVP